MKSRNLTPTQQAAWDRWKATLRELAVASRAFHASRKVSPRDPVRSAAIKAAYIQALAAAARQYRTCKDLGVIDPPSLD